MAVEVRVLVDGRSEVLSAEDITILPAAEVILAVRPFPAAGVRLDGRVRILSGGVEGLVAHDLSRSTGFHHLHIPPGHDFWFGTEDAKTGLAGVEAMLQYLRSSGTGWLGQLLFSDGSYLRDDHVVYAWLDSWADRVLAAARQIARSPRRGRSTIERTTKRGGGHVSLMATVGLLRTNPAKYLELSPDGPVVSGELRYVPRKVVVRVPTTTLDTPANRRAWWILRRLASLAAEVNLTSAGPEAKEQLRRWENEALGLLRGSFFAGLGRQVGPAPSSLSGRSIEESADSRYDLTYRAALDLRNTFGWAATRIRRDRYSFIQYADRIYQAFVATTVAAALGATASDDVLGRTQPAFSSEEWGIYYDTEPPASVLRSWRSYTTTADSWRPDLVLHHKPSGRVLILDAKYRSDGGRASESSRRDVMAYMAAYGVPTAVVCYPPAIGPLVTSRVAAHGQLLIELPIRPGPDLEPFLSAEVPGLAVHLVSPVY